MQDQNDNPPVEPLQGLSHSTTQTPALYLDYVLYEHYLEDSNLTDEEKQAFLDTLWQIVVSFVDLGFGVHPLQQICGENGVSYKELGTVQGACASTEESLKPINSDISADVTAGVTDRIPT